MPILEENEKHALRVVKSIRKAAGIKGVTKLRKGVRDNAGYCTLTASLDETGISYVDWWANDALSPVVRLPMRGYVTFMDSGGCVISGRRDARLNRFLKDFDAGRYPHLELPPSKIKPLR